mmetsp:Transcript_3894/g.7453  ORF Transcript_3894/g.7453 Transcript_3894/m.7453 type:complete len:162 (-) Transcript_3894:2938-3423(-)
MVNVLLNSTIERGVDRQRWRPSSSGICVNVIMERLFNSTHTCPTKEVRSPVVPQNGDHSDWDYKEDLVSSMISFFTFLVLGSKQDVVSLLQWLELGHRLPQPGGDELNHKLWVSLDMCVIVDFKRVSDLPQKAVLFDRALSISGPNPLKTGLNSKLLHILL